MGVTIRLSRGAPGSRLAVVASAVAADLTIIAVQLVFFGMPLGLWMRGVVLGMLTAVLAVGLALIYRANRVINFAQADLGSAPVALAVGLVVFWGWSYWVGLGIGLIGSLVLGAVVEVALVRRFRNVSCTSCSPWRRSGSPHSSSCWRSSRPDSGDAMRRRSASPPRSTGRSRSARSCSAPTT